MNPGVLFILFFAILGFVGFAGALVERRRVRRNGQLIIEQEDPGYRASGKTYVARIVPDVALDEEHKYFIEDISQIPDAFHRRIAAKELDKIITFWCNCRYGANRWTVEEDIYSPAHVDE